MNNMFSKCDLLHLLSNTAVDKIRNKSTIGMEELQY